MVTKLIISAILLTEHLSCAIDKGKLTERNSLTQMSSGGIFDLEDTDVDKFKKLLKSKPIKVAGKKKATTNIQEAAPIVVAPEPVVENSVPISMNATAAESNVAPVPISLNATTVDSNSTPAAIVAEPIPVALN